MNTARKSLALTVAASAVMTLTACGNSDQPVSIPTPSVQISLPPSTVETPTNPISAASNQPTARASSTSSAASAPASDSKSSSTPSMQSGSEQDAADSIALIKRWDAEMTKLYANPSQPVDTLSQFAVGQGLAVSETRIVSLRNGHQKVIGTRQWVSNKVAQNSYDSRGHYVTIQSCLDVSKVRVLDQTGKDVTKRTQNHYLESYVLAKPNNSDWKISIIENSGQTC